MSERLPAGTGNWVYDHNLSEWVEVKPEDPNLHKLLSSPKIRNHPETEVKKRSFRVAR